ncbi:MAG: MFS transporter [Halobacteriota archaeon]
MTPSLRTVKTDIETAGRRLWSEDRGWILLAISAGWALSIGVRFVYPALVPFIQSTFGIGLSTTGLLLTLLWGAYAVGHVPGGVLGDRIGEGNVLVLSTLVSAAAVVVVSTSVTVQMLFAGTVAFGLATALYGPTRFTVFTDIYPNRAGSAIGLTMAAGNVGNTAFPVLAAVIATYLTWRHGVAVFVPAFVAVGIVLRLTVPKRTSTRSSAVGAFSRETLSQIRSGITANGIPLIVTIQVSISFVIQGFSSFYPTYLTSVKGLSPGVAATVFGLFFALGAVITPISGGLMDRFGTRVTLLFFLGGTVTALWLLPFTHGLVPLVGVTVLFSAWNGCGVVTQTYIADSLPSDVQGTGLGTLKAGWMILGATAPLLMGLLGDVGYFDEAFLLLAIVASAGLALAVSRL